MGTVLYPIIANETVDSIIPSRPGAKVHKQNPHFRVQMSRLMEMNNRLHLHLHLPILFKHVALAPRHFPIGLQYFTSPRAQANDVDHVRDLLILDFPWLGKLIDAQSSC